MSALQAQIYEAQRDAGERVVLAHLEQSGLIVKTEAEKLAEARIRAHAAADAAERLWYEYAGMIDVGQDRIRAFEVYENLRLARRVR